MMRDGLEALIKDIDDYLTEYESRNGILTERTRKLIKKQRDNKKKD